MRLYEWEGMSDEWQVVLGLFVYVSRGFQIQPFAFALYFERETINHLTGAKRSRDNLLITHYSLLINPYPPTNLLTSRPTT